MPLEAGSTIGDYRVLVSLGAGGMGRVYKVQNLITNRTEAIKVLLPDLTEQPGLAERFMREIQVQASLVHPNITSLHTALRLENQLVMVMELVEGETIEHKLAAGPLPVERSLDYARQVLTALAYAHERNVIHRDIKPANIIIGNDGVVKLMDFGLAAAVAENDKRLTKTGALLGSLYYMSPEQVKGDPPSHRSDIYSFGLTLYEMLTGVRCIQGDSDYAIMTAHLLLTPEPPVRLNPEIPAALSDVVLKAIAKDPLQRFQTSAEFNAALTDYSKSSAMRTPPPAPTHSVAGNRNAMLAGGLVAVALAGAGIYKFGQSPKPAQSATAVPITEAVTPSPDTTPAPAPEPVSGKAATVPAIQPKTQLKTQAGSEHTAEQKADSKPEPVRVDIPTPAPKSEPAPKTVIAEAPPPLAAPAPTASTIASPPPRAIEKSPQQLEAEEWESIRTTRDLAKLQEFRRKYPNTPLAQQALTLSADIEWEQVHASRDSKVLRDFQSRYSASSHAAEAALAADRIEIASVLKRYEAAYVARDISQVRALSPGAARDATTKVEAFFKMSRSVNMTLQPSAEPEVSGDRATVQCRHSLTVEPSDGPRPRPVNDSATVRLRRVNSAWTIDDIEYK